MAETLFEKLEKRRQELGMPITALSQRSGVPLPTLNKILSGKSPNASITTCGQIAAALGSTVDVFHQGASEQVREQEAIRKATWLASMTAGTMAMENQTIDEQMKQQLINRTTYSLLSGSRHRLWSK